jgi:hypothetical protein
LVAIKKLFLRAGFLFCPPDSDREKTQNVGSSMLSMQYYLVTLE